MEFIIESTKIINRLMPVSHDCVKYFYMSSMLRAVCPFE